MRVVSVIRSQRFYGIARRKRIALLRYDFKRNYFGSMYVLMLGDF